MKKKVIVLLTVVSMFGLSGCSAPDWLFSFPFMKPSAEKVLERSADVMKDMESVSAVMNMDYDVEFSMDLGENGATMSMPMQIKLTDMDVNLQMADDVVTNAFMNGTVDVVMTLFGQEINQSIPVGMYVNKTEAGYDVYESSDGTSWQVESVSDDDFANMDMASFTDVVRGSLDTSGLKDVWEISDKKVNVGGVSAYQLSALLSGDILESTAAPVLGDAMTEYGMTDMEFPDVNVVECVDSETYYPLSLTMNLAEDNDFSMDIDGGSVIFRTLSMDITYDDFNAVSDDVVLVPDEIKDSAISVSGGLDSSKIVEGAVESNGFNLNDSSDWLSDTDSVDTSGHQITSEGYTIGLNSDTAESNVYLSDVYTSDNYLSATSEDGSYSLSVSIYDWTVNKDYVISEQQAANDYYKDASDVSDVMIGDVGVTTLSSYPVYWFSKQYTDTSLDFVYRGYDYYVVLDDNTTALVSVEEYSDVRQDITLNDVAAANLLDLIVVQKNK